MKIIQKFKKCKKIKILDPHPFEFPSIPFNFPLNLIKIPLVCLLRGLGEGLGAARGLGGTGEGVWNFEFFEFFKFCSFCFLLFSLCVLAFSFSFLLNLQIWPTQMPGLRTWGRQGPGGGILEFWMFWVGWFIWFFDFSELFSLCFPLFSLRVFVCSFSFLLNLQIWPPQKPDLRTWVFWLFQLCSLVPLHIPYTYHARHQCFLSAFSLRRLPISRNMYSCRKLHVKAGICTHPWRLPALLPGLWGGKLKEF